MFRSSRQVALARRPRSSVLPLLLAVVCSVLWSAGPASAHTSLSSSTPAAGAVVGAPAEVVTLVFDQPVSPQQAQVVVTGPDGADVAAGPAQVSGGTVTLPVGAWPTSGGDRLAYRVLAQDGHPITGEVPFEVARPAPTAPTTVPPTSAIGSTDAPPSARPATTGVALPLLAALGAGAGVLVAGAVRAARRAQVGR